MKIIPSLNALTTAHKLLCSSVYSCLALALCSQALAQEADTGSARFSVQIDSDSTNVRNRHYTVMQYENSQCKKPKGARLYRKKYAKETHIFEEKEIPTTAEFFFQIEYLEQRRREDRACTVLSGFRPQPNKTYKAVYDTSGQVSRCSVKIFDISDEEVEVTAISKPNMTCAKGKITKNKNSVPIHSVKPLY